MRAGGPGRARRSRARPARPDPGARGTVLSISSRALLGACERLGVSTTGLLERVGLAPEAVANPDARLPADKVAALWREVYRVCPDPDLALHAAESVPFGVYKVFDYAVSCSATVGEGLTQCARYFPLINDRARIVLDDTSNPILLELRFEGLDRPPRPYVEYAFAGIVARSRRQWRCHWPLVRVELAYPAPPSAREHQRLFDCEVRFGAEHNRLLLSPQTWSMPVPPVDPALVEIVRAQAEQRLRQLPRPQTLEGEVAVAIEGALAKGWCGIGQVASRLGITTRTLQRRLAGQRTSFAAALDTVRRAASVRYLGDHDVSLAEISFALGFSQPSAFNRAFKRWQGMTPASYRASLKT